MSKQGKKPHVPFSRRLEEFRLFKELTGMKWVPVRYRAPEGAGIDDRFGFWANDMRYKYHRGNSVSQEHIDALNAEGFAWVNSHRSTARARAETKEGSGGDDKGTEASTDDEDGGGKKAVAWCDCMRIRGTKAQKRWLLAPQPARPETYPKSVTDLGVLTTAGLRFGAIMADPPWRYGNTASNGAAENHYPTMSMEELRAMPVEALAAEDSFLFLWTTTSFLEEGLDLISQWGFTYKSNMVWCKTHFGMGNYWRIAHEHLLLGVRGKPGWRLQDLASFMLIQKNRHSGKPDEFRRQVESAVSGPYLELFGRMEMTGWTVFGNQVSPSLFADLSEDEARDVAKKNSTNAESGFAHGALDFGDGEKILPMDNSLLSLFCNGQQTTKKCG